MPQKVLLFLLALLAFVAAGPEEEHGVQYANRCETCKILAIELQERLKETGKTHDIIETGYSLDDVKPKKRTEYRRSELRLLETLEDVCDRVLTYNLHKERHDSTRFAKGMPETFKALHGLVNKGVEVNLGIPYDLWDKPPVEVTQMRSQCEDLLEKYEDVITDWYFKLQDEKTLIKHLCEDEVLPLNDRKCLQEAIPPPTANDNSKQQKDAKKRNKQQPSGKNAKKSVEDSEKEEL